MRGLGVVSVVLLAVAGGCTLLTDIPDDVSSGKPAAAPTGGTPAGGADAHAESSVLVTTDDAGRVIDANTQPEAGPSVVAFDAVGPNAKGAGGEGKSSPIVWSHTTSGSNRALFATVTVMADPDTNVTVTAVTYESAAFTLVAIQHANDQQGGYTTLWSLVNPAMGTHPVTVTFTGNADVVTAGSISLTGVDQTAPVQNVAKVGGNGTKAKLNVLSSPGNMVIGALVAACTVEENDQTQWVRNVTCGGGGGNGAQSVAAGANSVDLTYTLSNDWWGVVGADVKAATP